MNLNMKKSKNTKKTAQGRFSNYEINYIYSDSATKAISCLNSGNNSGQGIEPFSL